MNESTAVLFIFLLFIVSCTKSTDDTFPTEPVAGTLKGSVRLFDRFEQETFAYNDISIEVVDANNKSVNISPDLSGKFHIDNLLYGEVLLTIDKPGYGNINTVKIDHNKNVDTLSQIVLMEELPFPYKNFWFDYADGWASWRQRIDFVTNENFMAGHFFCFSKDPSVSMNVCDLTLEPGHYANVRYINNVISSSTTWPLDRLLASGFNVGDTIYVVEYPVAQMFYATYINQKKNFKVITYKMTNPSNVVPFILRN